MTVYKYIKILVCTSLLASFSYGQGGSNYCSAVIIPDDSTVCIGDTIDVIAFANLVNANQAFDFNSGNIPSGWTAAGGNNFAQPCGANPTGTNYYWASTTSGTPGIETAAFDVSCGGFLIFDYRIVPQGGSTPCEGPDLANEGVLLQYQIGAGPWTTIKYFQPDGVISNQLNTGTAGVAPAGFNSPFHTWDTYTIPIPLAAISTNTKFRWTQPNSSGTCCDNWGLDNIIINSSGQPCGTSTVLDWFYGTGPASNFQNGAIGDVTTFEAVITQDTNFVVDVYDTLGVYHCTSDTVSIYIHPDAMTYDLEDTIFSDCPTTFPEATVTNFQTSLGPLSVSWPDVPSVTNPTALPTGGESFDTITYYVDIMDGCGYTRLDSTILVVHQNLQVDSILIGDASGCSEDGFVSAYYSGEIGTEDLHWSGPGPNSSNGIDGSAFPNIGSGWYYFTIEDDACFAEDSAFVEALNAPTAVITPNRTEGCVPVTVTFENESTNANQGYYWDFGNGNNLDIATNDAQTQTFNATTTVMLVATQSNDCRDTATVEIEVLPCGCTDPAALNYSPLAVTDDGSCLYPEPSATLPNVFTPGNDGSNDMFTFLTVNNYSSVRLVITNRWGSVMFDETAEFDATQPVNNQKYPAWDGLNGGGSEAADGTYFYHYYVVGTSDGKESEGQGFLQLVRGSK